VSTFKFKPRKGYVRRKTDEWDALKPGGACPAGSHEEAEAIRSNGIRRGWKMRREKLDDGTFMVGRVE